MHEVWLCIEDLQIVEDRLVRVVHVQNEPKLTQDIAFNLHNVVLESGILLRARGELVSQAQGRTKEDPAERALNTTLNLETRPYL